MIIHWLLAAGNSCNLLHHVTRFSCDIFSLYVAVIYLQKGVQLLISQWRISDAAGFQAVSVALLTLITMLTCVKLGKGVLVKRRVGKILEDYAAPLAIILFTGLSYVKFMKVIKFSRIPIGKAFHPTFPRNWIIEFWKLDAKGVFLALPFAILLSILFWFDHNVSSLISQSNEFPLRKPPGFHWDIFLLGGVTGISGILGIPFPNGLIPQAPIHTRSLLVNKKVMREKEHQRTKNISPCNDRGIFESTCHGDIYDGTSYVVEQRFTNLAQGLLTLLTMLHSSLYVLNLIPQSVLAGLFLYMGLDTLQDNGIVCLLIYILSDGTIDGNMNDYGEVLVDNRSEKEAYFVKLRRLRRQKAIWCFVGIQLVGCTGTFIITQTVAAVGFPVFILALIPVRSLLLGKWFRKEELDVLDAPILDVKLTLDRA